MKIALLQINSTVGDIEGNSNKVLSAIGRAEQAGAKLAITPELALVGYPPLDLLYRQSFIDKAESAAREIAARSKNCPLLLGSISPRNDSAGRPLHNSALLLRNGMIETRFHKILLPTYDVFEEDRYFEPGPSPGKFVLEQHTIGVTICEDIWNDKNFWQHTRYPRDPVADLASGGCDLIVNLSASPWHRGKQHLRANMLASLAKRTSTPFALCNLVGGNDELVFDGNSLFVTPDGQPHSRARSFDEDCLIIDTNSANTAKFDSTDEQDILDALIMGTRDYVHKCGFKKVLIGLSGGIDSALTAVIAVRAMGAANVTGVAMPSRFSSEHSITDAQQLAANLGIKLITIPIEPPFTTILENLKPFFQNKSWDITEENIQSRLRGLTLMALSNKTGAMVLTTGNKSELAVGYCTIYGDMCGGLAVISDVPKTWVYRLARWINREKDIIPQKSIQKPPSAELRPNQTDQDSLPPYDVLDAILELHIEQNLGLRAILEKNIASEETVRKVFNLVHNAEYKRRQAAPGIKVTPRAFSRGWRMPIAKKSDF
jgi:NAD+ synthase (glutamine-hydrolysing)